MGSGGCVVHFDVSDVVGDCDVVAILIWLYKKLECMSNMLRLYGMLEFLGYAVKLLLMVNMAEWVIFFMCKTVE